MSLSWWYPSTGPAPSTPVVVDTMPDYFGGRPTPPPSPPRMRATVDDHAPCPPTPRCVPSGVVEDEPEWSNALDSGTERPTSFGHWSASELDQSTHFAVPLSSDSDDQDQVDVAPHVSDCLIYARQDYAYPSPILAMIERAKMDLDGLKTRSVNPHACGQPFKLFSLTAGNIPVTGLEKHDEQSFDYYDLLFSASPPRELEFPLSCRFSIGTIQALQHELRTHWLWVYPQPIPPVIIRLHDLIGPYSLSRRSDGYAFVVPTEDSIWATVCERGIDSSYRPISPSAAVETDVCCMGAALYYPQHIVASQFAVNVFLELPESAGPSPLCEYLGAYVLQAADGLTVSRSVWSDIDPEVQQSVFDRVPNHFEGRKHPSLGWPRLPYVRFCYYKWDQCIIGLVGGSRNRDFLAASRITTPCETDGESVYSDDYSCYSDSSFDTDQYEYDDDNPTSPSVYSPEPEYRSFLDFPLCE